MKCLYLIIYLFLLVTYLFFNNLFIFSIEQKWAFNISLIFSLIPHFVIVEKNFFWDLSSWNLSSLSQNLTSISAFSFTFVLEQLSVFLSSLNNYFFKGLNRSTFKKRLQHKCFFLWILRNLWEHLFNWTTVNDCS